jgi:lipopolysaccharide/colanic/teichoic acid biosynthesis glycosyltransferase
MFQLCTLKATDYWYNVQKRVAKNNSTFKIIDDPRVTKVGKFIRNTSIDELPQLINVLKEICL